MGATVPTARGEPACDECGASGARRTQVVFVDEREATLPLCEACVTEFEAAVLVETTHAVGGD